MLEFDHAIVVCTDVEATAQRLLDRYGLAAVPGGRHVGVGTANWLVPLGPDYVELMYIDDAEGAVGNPLGQWVQRTSAEGDGLAAVMLRTASLDDVAARLGLQPLPITRRRSDGTELSWRLAGLEQALQEARPVFVECLMPAHLHPGRDAAPHTTEPRGMAWVEWGGSADDLRDWLDSDDLDIRPVGGAPGPHRLGIATATGEITLDLQE